MGSGGKRSETKPSASIANPPGVQQHHGAKAWAMEQSICPPAARTSPRTRGADVPASAGPAEPPGTDGSGTPRRTKEGTGLTAPHLPQTTIPGRRVRRRHLGA
ncbi:hypothetical protein ACCO45_006981 [Purpureocillium lilacinum]|uniref:Uncharacterized protein n=1 Tax=Purpureocillium lilacinum TaxID=33203 RepID=A0ACC4DR62_PURLI